MSCATSRSLSPSKLAFVGGLLLWSAAAVAQSAAVRSVWDGVYTVEQAMRGSKQYRQTCAACHGPTLQGQGMAGALAGDTFVASWNGRSIEDLFTRIQATMPLDNPGTVTSTATREIVAFLLQANKFPPGPIELPPRTELKELVISRERP
jgi:mono/diheme cytochrome c family protein